MMASEPEDLSVRFAYHPALTEARRQEHEQVRAICLDAAQQLRDLMPPSRERSLVVTKLEEAMFWANAGIARQPDEPA